MTPVAISHEPLVGVPLRRRDALAHSLPGGIDVEDVHLLEIAALALEDQDDEHDPALLREGLALRHRLVRLGLRRGELDVRSGLGLLLLDHDLGAELAELAALELVVGPARHAGHPDHLAGLDEHRLARTRELGRLERVVGIHQEQAPHILEEHVGAPRRGAGLAEVTGGELVRTLLGVGHLLHRNLLGAKRGRRSCIRITRIQTSSFSLISMSKKDNKNREKQRLTLNCKEIVALKATKQYTIKTTFCQSTPKSKKRSTENSYGA